MTHEAEGGGSSSAVFLRLSEIWRIFRAVSNSFVTRRLIVSVVLVLMGSVIGALSPVAMKWVVDGLTAPTPAHSTWIILLACGYVLSQWLGGLLSSWQGYVHTQCDRRMNRVLSARLFDHVMRLPLRYHLERQTGAVNETLMRGLVGYQMLLNVTLYSILPVVTQLVTVAVVLVTVDQPVLMGMFFVALVGYSLAFTYGTAASARTSRDASAAQINAGAIMTDSILNAETVKYFTAEATVRKRLDQALSQTEIEWMRVTKSRTFVNLATATIFAGFLAATLLYAVREVLAGRMTVGTFVLINAYLFQLVGPIETIGTSLQELSQGYAFVEKMLELFRQAPEPIADSRAIPYRGAAALEFDGVSVSYRKGRGVLKDVSFVVPPGKTLGIVGASGTGKSTLVRLLVRLIEPDSGRILFDGIPAEELPLASLRRAIAVVPQDTVLFNDTIGYNIGFGRLGSTQAEIEEAARLAELHHFIAGLPEGYDTPVGERGVKLSGGERQRVSIARAALKHPLIYVFDEATSSLDSHTEREIVRNLKAISAQSTTIVIAHRLSTIVHADEIIVLDNGRVVERGAHGTLVGLDGRYASLWQAQQPLAKSAQADPSTS